MAALKTTTTKVCLFCSGTSLTSMDHRVSSRNDPPQLTARCNRRCLPTYSMTAKCNRGCFVFVTVIRQDVNRRHHRYSDFWSYKQIRQHKVLGNTGPSKSHQFTSSPLSYFVAGAAEGPARCESSLMEAAAAPSAHSKYIATKPRAHRPIPYKDS